MAKKLKTREEKGLSEAAIEGAVTRHARQLCIMQRKYTSPNHRSVPDRIFLPYGGRPFFIEFKREKGGKLTVGQSREIAKLTTRGYKVYVVDNIEAGKAILDEYHALGL